MVIETGTNIHGFMLLWLLSHTGHKYAQVYVDWIRLMDSYIDFAYKTRGIQSTLLMHFVPIYLHHREFQTSNAAVAWKRKFLTKIYRKVAPFIGMHVYIYAGRKKERNLNKYSVAWTLHINLPVVYLKLQVGGEKPKIWVLN